MSTNKTIPVVDEARSEQTLIARFASGLRSEMNCADALSFAAAHGWVFLETDRDGKDGWRWPGPNGYTVPADFAAKAYKYYPYFNPAHVDKLVGKTFAPVGSIDDAIKVARFVAK